MSMNVGSTGQFSYSQYLNWSPTVSSTTTPGFDEGDIQDGFYKDFINLGSNTTNTPDSTGSGATSFLAQFLQAILEFLKGLDTQSPDSQIPDSYGINDPSWSTSNFLEQPSPTGNGPTTTSHSTTGTTSTNGPTSNTNYPSDIPANVRSWVDEAATQVNPPMTDQDKINMAIIAMHESGGDPNAVNNWDQNAQEGHPSIGLVQTIQPTFDAFKAPGHDDIRNPVDNIIAGYNYAKSTYGSTDNVPGIKSLASGGSYVGY